MCPATELVSGGDCAGSVSAISALLLVAAAPLCAAQSPSWRVVADAPGLDVDVAPDGLSFLTRASTLWDTFTGARVVTLPGEHTFSRTGGLLVGVHRSPGDHGRIERLSVLDATSGELLAQSLAIGADLVGAPSIDWSPEPFDGSRAREDGHWYGVRRFAVAGGTLQVHLPLAERAIARGVRLDVRADGRRALLQYGASPRGRGLLIDPHERLPLATWNLFGRDAAFTHDGASVVFVDGGQVHSIDAVHGVARRALVVLGLDGPHWRGLPFALTSGSVFVAEGDRVVEFALARLDLVRAVNLDYPLAAGEPAPVLQVDLHARALVFGHLDTVAAYDLDRGRRLWSRSGTLIARAERAAPEGRFVLAREHDSSVLTLDTRTGGSLASTRRGVLRSEALAAFTVTDAGTGVVLDGALVQADDGAFRSFATADGATLGRADLHVGRRDVGFDLARERPEVVTTWDGLGRVALLGLPTLTERARLELGAEVQVLAASAEHGVVVARRAVSGGITEVTLRRVVDGAVLATLALVGFERVAVTNDRARVVLLARARAVVLDLVSGATQFDVELPPPAAGAWSAAALSGETQLVLGTERAMFEKATVGVRVFDLARGAFTAEHRTRAGAVDVFGGAVEQIVPLPQHGRLAYVIGPDPHLIALDTADWRELATVALGDVGYEVSAAHGSARFAVGGRLVDLASFEVIARESLRGLHGVAEIEGGRAVLGLEGGRASVLAGDPLVRRFVRQETARGGALLLTEDGRRLRYDGDLESLADVHLTRGGASVPLACFAALRDEHGAWSLDTLPEPPRITRGPARVIVCTDEAVPVECEVREPLQVEALWVRAAGRAPQRASMGEAGVASVLVTGPWPLDLELVAVAQTGVESRPWRTRIVSRR
jgi:hypothetical protein